MVGREKKISLSAALLININIIIGAGVFLNIKPLTRIAGPLGFAGYLLGGIILLPFVITLAKLAQAYPVSGGLYVYSKKHLSPFVGFVSGWSYFIGKTVSAAFLAYAFTSFFQNQIPLLQQFSTLLLAYLVIALLVLLNILGAHIGGRIQYFFILTRLIPISFVLIFGFLRVTTTRFAVLPALSSVIATVPIALYALMGFEITCSIGHLLKDGKRNIPRAIIGSFGIVAIIYIAFQAIMYGALGAAMFTTQQPLTHLATLITASPLIGQLIIALVFTSVIAGSFGILTSNCWNLHVLAQNGHLPGCSFLARLSKSHVPWASLIFEGVVACLMLGISKNQIALQSMSVFGVVGSFLLSALAAFYATKKGVLKRFPLWLPITAIASCSYILFLCLQKIQAAGVSVPYLLFLFSGLLLAFISCKKRLPV